MRYWLLVPILIAVFTGCGTFDKSAEEPCTNDIVVDVLTENKNDIEYIKNRTADDIELGYKVRKVVLDENFDDEQVGAYAREIVMGQPTTPKDKKINKDDDSPLVWFAVAIGIIIAIIVLDVSIGIYRKKKCNG